MELLSLGALSAQLCEGYDPGMADEEPPTLGGKPDTFVPRREAPIVEGFDDFTSLRNTWQFDGVLMETWVDNRAPRLLEAGKDFPAEVSLQSIRNRLYAAAKMRDGHVRIKTVSKTALIFEFYGDDLR